MSGTVVGGSSIARTLLLLPSQQSDPSQLAPHQQQQQDRVEFASCRPVNPSSRPVKPSSRAAARVCCCRGAGALLHQARGAVEELPVPIEAAVHHQHLRRPSGEGGNKHTRERSRWGADVSNWTGRCVAVHPPACRRPGPAPQGAPEAANASPEGGGGHRLRPVVSWSLTQLPAFRGCHTDSPPPPHLEACRRCRAALLALGAVHDDLRAGRRGGGASV